MINSKRLKLKKRSLSRIHSVSRLWDCAHRNERNSKKKSEKHKRKNASMSGGLRMKKSLHCLRLLRTKRNRKWYPQDYSRRLQILLTLIMTISRKKSIAKDSISRTGEMKQPINIILIMIAYLSSHIYHLISWEYLIGPENAVIRCHYIFKFFK